MFGYIRPVQPQLRVCELEVYKSVYCGLCRRLGESFGPLARLTLNYDFTFLALMAMAVGEEEPRLVPGRCMLNPLKKSLFCESSEPLGMAADLAILVLGHKLKDDREDEGAARRIGAAAGWMAASRAFGQAALRQPEAARVLEEAMARQGELERAGCPQVDEAAEPTALSLAAMFRQLSSQEGQRRVLDRLGYLVGRYVYLIDALDDLEEDLSRGGYNPFAAREGLTAPQPEQISRIREDARGTLYLTIGEIGRTYNLLEVRRFGPILENILFLGLKASVDRLLDGECKEVATHERPL